MNEIEITEIRELNSFLEERFDYDFRNYAMSSFRRRIRRVLDLYKLKSVAELIQLLDEKEDFLRGISL